MPLARQGIHVRNTLFLKPTVVQRAPLKQNGIGTSDGNLNPSCLKSRGGMKPMGQVGGETLGGFRDPGNRSEHRDGHLQEVGFGVAVVGQGDGEIARDGIADQGEQTGGAL